NEFIILQADASLRKTHLGRVHKGRVIPLTYSRVSPYGIKPRNAGQYFMQEALMQSAEEAPLVIIKGQAGTAKTFYSLAVGLEKIINHPTGEYRRILICRPNAQFDSDIGFLPGDEQEKISPLMRPIIDNSNNSSTATKPNATIMNANWPKRSKKSSTATSSRPKP
ncbi:MAG: PhoH family protein, partial [Megasphaera sp.]